MQEENTVSADFYLAVLENSLDVLASALRVAAATSTSESFHLSEAPIALDEARAAVVALKKDRFVHNQNSPEAAA